MIDIFDKDISDAINFWQLNLNERVFFWSNIKDNPHLLLFSFKDNRVKSFLHEQEKQQINQTTPIGKITCDGRPCIALIDSKGSLYVKTDVKKHIQQHIGQTPLDIFF